MFRRLSKFRTFIKKRARLKPGSVYFSRYRLTSPTGVADLCKTAVIIANAMKALTKNSGVGTINKPKELVTSCVKIVLNNAGLNVLRRIGRNIEVSDFAETHRCNGCVFHITFNNK